MVTRSPHFAVLHASVLMGMLVACGAEAEPVEGHESGAHGTATAPEASGHVDHLSAVCGDAVIAHAPDALSATQHGYSIDAEGNGVRQSPINIRTRDVVDGDHAIEQHYGTSTERVNNKGYTVQLDYDAGSWVQFDGVRYELAQFHFHTPSEHHVDGLTFPLEMHLVHVAEPKEGESPRYLVVGVLFREGLSSQFLDRFLDEIPEEAHEGNEVPEAEIDLDELIGERFEDSAFYHYKGSLTTPPYTESVQWVVLERVYQVAPEQVQRLNRIEGNNARHVQSLEGRQVEIQFGDDR